MMIVTSKEDDDNDGDGAIGDEVDNVGDGVTGNGATGYDDIDGDGLALLVKKLKIMAKAQWATTTTMMAMAQRDATIDAHPYFRST